MFISLQRIIKSGLLNFRRNSALSFASVGMMTLTLSMLTFLLFLRFSGDHIITLLRDKADISVYFKIETPEEEIKKLQEELTQFSEVKEVTYISREAALDRFKERYASNRLVIEALKEVDKNPLPASLNVKAYQGSQYAAIAQFFDDVRFKPFINKVNYSQNRQMIERLFSFTDFIASAGVLISFALGIIAVLVAFNTIRLAIYNVREEIGIMRLVGADNWFIRGPFVVMGTLSGVIAAAATMVFGYILVYYLSPRIEAFIPGLSLWVYYTGNLLQIFLLQIVVGIGIGVFSSIIAMNRYLRT